MEWSLHVSNAGEVTRELPVERLPSVAAQCLGQTWKYIPVARIAAGTEFCENLTGGLGWIESITAATERHRLPLTLLTPYVSDSGLDKLLPLFDHLQRRTTGTEVVFNDWGTLNVLLRDFPALRPVQGRLLNKSLRDPRITGLYPETTESISGLIAISNLRRTNLDISGYVDMLVRLGVGRVELDNLPQGLDLEGIDPRLKVGVYFPYGFVATSRSCMAAGLHYRPAEKFVHGATCRHECQTHQVVFSYTNSPFENRDQQFLLKGNTYFFEHSASMLGRLVENSRVDRLIIQSSLPMYA